MRMPPILKRSLGAAFLAALGAAALYLVTVVYATREYFLAGTLLVVAALAAWLYTSARTYAFRYLFPGIAAAVLFVVFPMLYMVGIGFTNYSSSNLLEYPRARQYLLDQTCAAGEGGSFDFALYPDGAAFRGRLEDRDTGRAYVSAPFPMPRDASVEARAVPEGEAGFKAGDPVELGDIITHEEDLKKVTFVLPGNVRLTMTGLSEYSAVRPLYRRGPGQTLVSNQDGTVLAPDFRTGFFVTPSGDPVQPGFQVKVGLGNYKSIFTDPKWRDPFLKIFAWTVAFSFLSVFLTMSLGMVLAVLLNWELLRGRSVYRVLLFLPYAVPAFISILVWKGLFNNSFGEINAILSGLFGLRPHWFSDPWLSKCTILIVNTWLGFPYMMVVCMGLIKAIPQDLYEASAVAGAGPLTNFFRITVPLIRRPLTPLLIASFAFNFNNFVLIQLLTAGRPDFPDVQVQAGSTDILISYVYRNAFLDSGQKFGMAAALSTVIFLIIAAITLVQMRTTKLTSDETR